MWIKKILRKLYSCFGETVNSGCFLINRSASESFYCLVFKDLLVMLTTLLQVLSGCSEIHLEFFNLSIWICVNLIILHSHIACDILHDIFLRILLWYKVSLLVMFTIP